MSGARAMGLGFNGRRLAQAGFVLLLAAALLLMLGGHAHAADIATDASKCKDYPGLTNRIAACVRLTITDVASDYFTQFYTLVKDGIYAFLTLGIVIYGVLIAGGIIEHFSRGMMLLALKIALISFFVANVDWMYTQDMALMDATSAAVITFIPQQDGTDQNGAQQQEVCLDTMRNQAAVPTTGQPIVAPWMAMDCILDSVIGLKRDSDTTTTSQWANKNLQGQGMARGLVAFFMSSAKTSVMGLMIGVLGFIFIYSLVFLIIKALFTYIGAYIGLTFLMIISPIFIPLVLFQPTKQYFDKWLKMVISFSLQPVLILIFITLTITAVDLATYSGDYSVMYKIAGDASRQQGFTLNSYLDQHGISTKKPAVFAEVKGNHDNPQVDKDKNTPGVFESNVSKCDGSAQAKNQSGCNNSHPIQWWHNAIDWQKLADARSPAVQIEGDAKTTGEEESREVLAAILFAGIVIFIMNGLLAVVPMIANDLIADYGVSPNLYAKMGKLPMQDKASSAVRNIVGSIGQQVTGRMGPQ